jgi:hypothetical protein
MERKTLLSCFIINIIFKIEYDVVCVRHGHPEGIVIGHDAIITNIMNYFTKNSGIFIALL